MSTHLTPSSWVGGLAALIGPRQAQPVRVGVLNTGELVLVDGAGGAQVLSAPTTALIREQLIHTDMAASECVLFPGSSAKLVDDPTARMHG